MQSLMTFLIFGVIVALNASHQEHILVKPIDDLPWLELRHSNLSNATFIVRLPEHIVTLKGMVAQQVKWKKVSKNRWRYYWGIDDQIKRREQTDFRGEVSLSNSELAFTFTIKNPTENPWGNERYNAFDVMAGNVPMFHDPEGSRTFVYIKDRFVSVREALKGKLSKDMTGWMLMAKNPKNPKFREFTERLMAKVSNDGKWVLAIVSDSANGVTFNLQTATSCIHQNRTWTPLEPNEEKMIHGKVYLFRGTLDDLWKRYVADKAQWEQKPNGGKEVKSSKETIPYLPTVWSPPTMSKTLQRLHALRPKQLPKHPLATWISDRFTRDSKRTPNEDEIQSALHAFKRYGTFFVRDDESGLWVSNGKVGIAFLPPKEGRGIASLYHLTAQTECIFKQPEPYTPWRLQVWNGNKLEEVDWDGMNSSTQLAVGKRELRITFQWEGKWNVQATVTLSDDSPLLRWRATVTSRNDDSIPYTLSFPVIRHLGGAGENDLVTSWGSGRGQLFRGLRGALWNSGSRYPDSNWSVQFLAMSFGDATLYLACHDGAFYTKSFKLHPGEEFYFTTLIPIKSNFSKVHSFAVPYDIVIGPIAGDWYDAARRYREWAVQQKWCARGPLRHRAQQGKVARRMIEAPFVVRPNWTYDVDEEYGQRMKATEMWGTLELERNRKLFGNDVPLAVWWYKWQRQRFDDDMPLFEPYSDVASEFRREVNQGLVVMPYTQSALWDTHTSLFDERARAAVCKKRDGTLRTMKFYWCEVGEMCLSQPLCRDVTCGLAKAVADIGANAVYLDVFPVMRECWDTAHGHPLGVGGNWWAKSVRGILERIKRERGWDFGVTMEYFVEPYIDLCDLQMSWFWVETVDCPLIPAIYSGYAVMSGSHTHKHYPDGIIAFRIKVGRCFLWGSQLGRSILSDYLFENAKGVFLKRLVRLKVKAKKFLTYGCLLRPPRWLSHIPRITVHQWIVQQKQCPPFRYDAVEAALWKARDGELGLFIVNYDDVEHTVQFRTDFLSNKTYQVSLLTAETERAQQQAKPGNVLTLRIPPADALLVLFH